MQILCLTYITIHVTSGFYTTILCHAILVSIFPHLCFATYALYCISMCLDQFCEKGASALVIRELKGGTEEGWWGCVMMGVAGRKAASKL